MRFKPERQRVRILQAELAGACAAFQGPGDYAGFADNNLPPSWTKVEITRRARGTFKQDAKIR